MLFALAFDRLGVAVSDLYFVNPIPGATQEGAEQGVRLEVRVFERSALKGSVYSAQPIEIGRPIWRVDLLESVDNPGSLDRAHHHPRFRGWEPSRRHFVEEMSADPVAWVGKRLEDLDGLLDEAGVSAEELGHRDREELRAAVPDIVAAVRRMLARVHAGELAQQEDSSDAAGARLSWL
jgi:hypothetical protein